jgi:hypothetical protein
MIRESINTLKPHDKNEDPQAIQSESEKEPITNPNDKKLPK